MESHVKLSFFTRGGGPKQLKFEPRPTTAPVGGPRRFPPARASWPRAAATANLAFDLKKAYMSKLRPSLYIPLGNVLDLEKSLPGLVAKADFREFYQHRPYSRRALEATADPFAADPFGAPPPDPAVS